jgi:hypothetical protein
MTEILPLWGRWITGEAGETEGARTPPTLLMTLV